MRPQTVKKPFREVWRAKALQMQSESGDMCGGFGSLAQQGFLTAFPARESRRDERETPQISEKDAAGGLFRHADAAFQAAKITCWQMQAF